MTAEQELTLAKYLRELSKKLDNPDYDWTQWVMGSLEGIAEMLELTNSFKPK